MGKILSIKEKVPQEATLPDGNYTGTWGGYVIELNYEDKTYELNTEEGVRGMNIKVIINVRDGVATYHTVNN
jgi:hypothetical protein